jgi:hypothetical protein
MFGFLTRTKVQTLEDAKASLVSAFGEQTGDEFAESIAERWWAKREAGEQGTTTSRRKVARKRVSQPKRKRGRPRKMGVRAAGKTTRVTRGQLSGKCLTWQDLDDGKKLVNFLKEEDPTLSQFLGIGRIFEKLGLEKATRLVQALS